MSKSLRAFFWCVSALALAAGSSLATVREIPYSLALDPNVTALKVGQIQDLNFTLTLKPGSRFEGVRVSNSSDFEQSQFSVAAGKTESTREISLRGLVLSEDSTIDFELDVDGEVYVETVDFSVFKPGELIKLTDETVIDAVDAATARTMWRPEPTLKIETTQVDANKYTIHAHGRLVYMRPAGGGAMGNVLVGVDGAEVHLIDEDGFDNTLATTTTDVNGYWDIYTDWGGGLIDNEPDLTVKFDSGNSSTQVGPNSITTRYNWRTPVRENYTGTDLDIGTYIVSGELAKPLHILTTLTRAWRWYQSKGITLPGASAHWPDASWSYYTAWNNNMHFLSGHSFSEDTITHELGHHYMHHFSSSVGPDYCNDTCERPDRCGHCGWCEENINDAWGEGFPTFIGWASVEEFQSLYSPDPVAYNSTAYEEYSYCVPKSRWPSAPQTELALTAVLRDLTDNTNDSETVWYTGLRDQLQMPFSDLLAISQTFGGTSSISYLNAVRSFMEASPSYTQAQVNQFLAIIAMNGFPVSPPTMPLSVSSATHTINVSSANNFPYMYWTAPYAEAGIDHYLVSFTLGGPGTPTLDIGNRTNYTPSVPMAPGSYWFNVRAVDQTELLSPINSSFGPLIISAATPLNFAPYQPEFWSDGAVPSRGSVPGTPPEPTLLDGGVHNSYGQFSFKNTSLSGFILPLWYSTVEVDGHEMTLRSFPAQTIVGSQEFVSQNMGPFTVRGGRHTFVCTADGRYNLSEANETDNWDGGQYIWTPPLLSENVAALYSAPRSRTGGWNKVPATFFNGDGYRITQTGWWNAVTLETSQETSDYSLALFNPSGGVSIGFSSTIGFSGRPAGSVDAVFTNRNEVGGGTTQFDVGIYNFNDGSSSYTIKHTTSLLESYGASFNISWSASDRIALREFYVSAAQVGPLSPQIQLSDPSEEPVHMMLLDNSFTTGDVYDYVALAITDETGYAQLDVDLVDPGYYCLVFLRDPPGYASKRGAVDLSVQLAPTMVNLKPDDTAAGWVAPLVPRGAADGTPGSVLLPAVLPGDVASTYLNIAMLNNSLVDADGSVRVNVERDGQFQYWVQPAFLNAGNSFKFNSTSAQTIPAGRHTLTMACDSLDGFVEANEEDNVYGVQYVWQPSELSYGPTISRAAPRDPFAGIETIPVTLTPIDEDGSDGGGVSITPMIWPNCDGVRSPQFAPQVNDAYWGGFALMSRTASNADLRLHEISTGATKGFAEDLAQSNWGTNHSDFVFANFNYGGSLQFDAGVLGTAGTQAYDIQVISSKFLDANPNGSYGDFNLGSGEIVNLHEIYLSQGIYVMSLENRTPGTRLGVSLYGALNEQGQPYFGKSDLFDPTASSWISDGGPLEYLTIQIPQGGDNYYCLAVWKVYSEGLYQPATYKINIHSGATSTDEPNVLSNALVGVYPNPFNPRTSVAFELASPSDVKIELYDVRGARVRSIALGSRPAGRHQYELSGVDQQGASLASGRYIVQLIVGDKRFQRSITLVK